VMDLQKSTVRHTVPLLFLAAFLLGGCLEEKTGPEPIHWDRDVGMLCSMIISDARFAAEVRGGPDRKLYKFDDIGCAVNWLNAKPWAGDEEIEIWVAEQTSTRDNVRWLNARNARYVTGKHSPMNYGYGAVMQSLPGSIDFVELTDRILADAPNHICARPMPVRKILEAGQ